MKHFNKQLFIHFNIEIHNLNIEICALKRVINFLELWFVVFSGKEEKNMG